MKKMTRFLASAWFELKRVKWPTLPQVVRYTIGLIVFILFVAGFSFVVRWIYSIIIEMIGG